MIPSIGRRVGAAKQWKLRCYCCHGNCTSNTADCDPNVKLLPFPKPCAAYFNTIVDPSVKHQVNSCGQCTKAKHWIHLCKRADAKLQNLSDINKFTYICSKHFANLSGPTESNPDPYPADKEASLLKRVPSRKRPTERGTPPKPKRRRQPSRLRSVSPSFAEPPHGSNQSEPPQMATGEEEISLLDHGYASVPGLFPSKKKNMFENLANTLFLHNFMVEFDHETICINLGKGYDNFFVLISRTFRINVQVHEKNIGEDHSVWKSIPRYFDPTQGKDRDLIESIEKVKSEWRICKCRIMVRITTEYDLYQINPAADHGPHMLASPRCSVLSRKEVCESCKKMLASRERRMKHRKTLNQRKKLRYLTRSEALAWVQKSRKALYLQKQKTERLRKKIAQLIQMRGTRLPSDVNNDFLDILTQGPTEELSEGMSKEKIDLTKLFFREQIQAAKAKSPNGHRWHPLMLKWCLYLKAKSSSTYSALRNVITLPSEKRLFQIQAHTHIKPGFQEEVTKALVQEFADAGPEDHTRYCSILFDEMKIHEDLVYKSSTNELIGYVQLSKVDQLLENISLAATGALPNQEELASHVLELMVRGISTSILSTFAYFPTRTLQARHLFNILLEAVEILEGKDIRVLAFVSDGAAANRALYRMLVLGSENWCMVNPYADHRKIFFVCDAPHLLKTTRNCFSNSGSHKKSRLLWKNGKHIEWRHIQRAYQHDLSDGIRTLINITDEHLHLTPCSLMKVKLAAQVLSRRMGLALRALQSEDTEETIHFVEIFNKWFDIMNARNLKEGRHKRNDDLLPFTSPDDSRLHWLEKDFVEYLDGWANEVAARPGSYTTSERNKMLLSTATVEGLKITAHSVVALTKFMLAAGAQFVLSYKFNQDPVELDFSKQRGAGGCNTNPSVMSFGDNMAKLKSMKAAKKEIVYAGKGNISQS